MSVRLPKKAELFKAIKVTRKKLGGEHKPCSGVLGPGPDSQHLLPPEIEAELQRLANLPFNWDSYGAFPVSPVALELTRELLRFLHSFGSLNSFPLSEAVIAPDPDGTITIEWHLRSGGTVLLTITANDRPTSRFVDL